MVTPVVQPTQHVANYFQLIETTLREYKSPSHAWPKGEREIIDIILCWNPISSLISCASCTFPDFYRKPLFPGDVHQFICHLVCTSLESILVRQGQDNSDDGLFEYRGRIQVISPPFYYCTCCL